MLKLTAVAVVHMGVCLHTARHDPTHSECHPSADALQGIADAMYDTSPEDQLSWLHSLHVEVDALLKDIPALKLEVSGDYAPDHVLVCSCSTCCSWPG